MAPEHRLALRHRIFGLRTLVLQAFGALLLSLASVAAETEPPGLARESAAEEMERRDELIAAQMEYLSALEDVLHATAQGGEDTKYLAARAEFLIEKAIDLSARSGNTEDVMSVLRRFLKETANDNEYAAPLLLDRARWHLSQLQLKKGRAQEATDTAAALGLIRNWRIIGPFDNERGRSFDTPFAPEELPINFAAPQPGKKRGVHWRQHDSRNPLGFIDFSALFTPNTECLAYALCEVNAPADMDAALRIGSADGIAVWLNGTEIFRTNSERQAGFDQNACGLRLRQGRNLILLKVAQATGAWGFYARITSPDGRPIPELKFIKPPGEDFTPRQATQAPGAVAVDQGGITLLAERVQGEDAEARDAYYLAFLLMIRGHLGQSQDFDKQLLRLAIERDPGNPIYRLTLARAAGDRISSIPDREENERRLALLTIRNSNKDEVAATVALADYYLRSMGSVLKSAELVNEALAINPLSLNAQLLRYDIFRRRGWTARAANLIADITRRHPTNFDARLREGMLLHQTGITEKALQTMEAARRIDAVDATAFRSHVRMLQDAGQIGKAVSVLEAYLAISPYDEWTLQQLAMIHRRSGHLDEALRYVEERLSHCPEDARMIAERGFCLHALAREEEARKAWQQALLLQPVYPELQEYIRVFGMEPPSRQETDLSALAESLPPIPPQSESAYAYPLYDLRIRLNGDGTRSQEFHRIARIYNRDGAEELRLTRVYYDPDIERVTVVAARVLHADGSTGEADVEHARSGPYAAYILHFPALSSGDIVEIHYVTDRFQQNFFGNYFGNIHTFRKNVPIAVSRYAITNPAGRDLFTNETGGAPRPAITRDETAGLITRTWEMKDLAPIADEANMPPDAEISPAVQASTFQDWDALATWYWHLIRPQNEITPAIRRQVDQLVRGMPDDRAKVSAIFDWVSHRVRNIAWSFGVHGYKPYSANSIFTRRFGDCKDKTTLINVMARELGLEAWPVLLLATDPSERVAGRGREDLSLPILGHFNHCISQIRIGDQALYLDGTISYRTIEGVHYTCAGAKAVVIRPNGAEMVQIPPQRGENNLWDEQLQVMIADNGNANLSGRVLGRGNVALYMRAYFGRPNVRDEVLRRIASRAYGESRGASTQLTTENLPPDSVELSFSVGVNEMARVEGTQMRLPLPAAWLRGALGDGGAIPDRLSRYAPYSIRKHDILLPLAFKVKRSLSITWPAQWQLRNVLQDTNIDLPFGRLTLSHTMVGSTLTIDYLLTIDSTRIPVDRYPDFRKLCVLADQIDRFELLLEKQ